MSTLNTIRAAWNAWELAVELYGAESLEATNARTLYEVTRGAYGTGIISTN
jgi:hypothetical protein